MATNKKTEIDNKNKIKVLALDVDGVLTDGTKAYDENHNVLFKSFLCKDFTAIKRIMASGIKVVLLSGDNFNQTMATKRNLPFYCTRGEDLSLDKSKYLKILQDDYGVKLDEIAFVGDDYFDLSMFKRLNYTFCPCDAPKIIRKHARIELPVQGGRGVIVRLYDWLIANKYIDDATEEEVAALDKLEATSQEMK